MSAERPRRGAPVGDAWVIETGMEGVGAVGEAVRALAAPVLGEDGAGDVELALVEAVTNVIRHGYGPGGGPVRIEAEVGEEGVLLRVFDWGKPIPGEALAGAGPHRFDFDPSDREALPQSGMGLSLITALMDEVSYRADGGQNLLRLRRSRRDD